MILMLCGSGGCGLDVMVLDVQYVPNSEGNAFSMIYHLGCENLHKSTITGEIYVPNPEGPESRVIKFLVEESAKRYGKTISN